MYKALVCCRAGMGSSMLLKIKADQVIKENGFPIVTEHGNVDSLVTFDGELVITLSDFEAALKDKVPYVLAVNSIVDKEEMKAKLEAFLQWKETK